MSFCCFFFFLLMLFLMKSLQSFLLFSSVHNMSGFSPLCCFDIFSLSLFFSNCIMICLAVVYFVLSLLGFIEFLGSLVYSFHQIWTYFSHYFFISFSLPSPHSRIPVTLMLKYVMLSHRSLRLCSFFQPFSPVFQFRPFLFFLLLRYN